MSTTLDHRGFAKLLGTEEDDFVKISGSVVDAYDFTYTIQTGEELEATLLSVVKAIDGNTLSVSGKDRHDDWEKGWLENLRGFVESNCDLSALTPKYVRKIKTKRLFSQYITPTNDDFEVNFYTVYRHYLFKKYFSEFENVYEFGCGTGYNLVILAKLFPEKRLWGLDWAESSVNLVDAIASSHGLNMKGRLFDYFQPDHSLEIPENSVFLTLNSMEQIGRDYDNFLKLVIRKRPRLCINSEPFLELYDQDNLLDYLAMGYHKKRNYLNGYLDALRKLEKEGKIEILKVQRVHFGSIYHEGYSYVLWRVR